MKLTNVVRETVEKSAELPTTWNLKSTVWKPLKMENVWWDFHKHHSTTKNLKAQLHSGITSVETR